MAIKKEQKILKNKITNPPAPINNQFILYILRHDFCFIHLGGAISAKFQTVFLYGYLNLKETLKQNKKIYRQLSTLLESYKPVYTQILNDKKNEPNNLNTFKIEQKHNDTYFIRKIKEKHEIKTLMFSCCKFLAIQKFESENHRSNFFPQTHTHIHKSHTQKHVCIYKITTNPLKA